MKVWDLETMTHVLGLRSKQIVHDREVVDAPDVVAFFSEVRQRTAAELIKQGQRIGVRIDAGDIVHEQVERQDVGIWSQHVTARWSPTNRVCELRGGAGDGAEIHTQVGQVVRYPIPGTRGEVAYELAGWDQRRRCWVYQPAPSTARQS